MNINIATLVKTGKIYVNIQVVKVIKTACLQCVKVVLKSKKIKLYFKE